MSSTEEDLKIHVPQSEEEYYENVTARFNREHKPGKSRLENLPVEVVNKVTKFLYGDANTKLNLATLSPSMRISIRSTPIDLTAFDIGVEDLVEFLRNNKDLFVNAITINSDQSEGTLRPLRKYMPNLTKINIYGYKKLDLSELENCRNLKHCKIPNLLDVTPYLVNCKRLKTLTVRGDSNIRLKLPKLEKLVIMWSAAIKLNLLDCPSLYKLTMMGGTGITRLKATNNLTKLYLDGVKDVDYSLLERTSNLHTLVITSEEKELVDLNNLPPIKTLKKLVINNGEIRGDFAKFINLQFLSLELITISVVPLLPNKLKWLEINKLKSPYTVSFELLSLRNIADCKELETLIIVVDNVDLEDIKSCTNLKNLSINSNVDNLVVIHSLPNITNLSLEVNHVELYLKLSNCPLLESLYLIDEDLNRITCLSNCNKLTTLYIKSELLKDITPLTSCPNLTNMKLDCPNIKENNYIKVLDSLALLESGNSNKGFGKIESFLDKAKNQETIMETPD